MTDGAAFGAVLNEAMTTAGVEVKKLARDTGIALSTIYAYINGTRRPSGSKVDKIAHELRVGDEMRARMLAAAGFDTSSDMAVVAADLVRGLPSAWDRELAVELLRTQARFAARDVRRVRDREAARHDQAMTAEIVGIKRQQQISPKNSGGKG